MTDKKSLTLIALIAAAAIMIMLFGSCRSIQYVPVETVRTEKVTVHDSIYQEVVKHDSVMVEKRGDTVFVDRWHTLYQDRWRDRWRDSIRTDSIQVPYPVPAQLTKWQTFCCDYGKIMIGCTAAAVVILFILLIYWLKFR